MGNDEEVCQYCWGMLRRDPVSPSGWTHIGWMTPAGVYCEAGPVAMPA